MKTQAQALLEVLHKRKFTNTELAKITGIHHVTLSNISKGNYSGSNSLWKLEGLVSKIPLTREEEHMIYNAYYHIDDNVTKSNGHDTKEHIPPSLPANKFQNSPLNNLYQRLNTDEKISRMLVDSAIKHAQWLIKIGTCALCNHPLSNGTIQGYIKNKFVVLCSQCKQECMEYIKPNPYT